jgi:NADPH:quinone reductase-like Zn-dependent oxidoreductase
LVEVVDANGVAGWTAGERAHALLAGTRGRGEGQGSWQQFVAAPPGALTRPPPVVPDAVAAQLRGNPASALGLLETLAPPPGEWLVHSAAASTLGRMLITMARLRDVRTVAVLRSRAGREHQVRELQQLGADVILAADEDDIAARVMQLTAGRGAWGATDAVAGEMTGRLAAAVHPGGTVLVYGMLAGTTCTAAVADIMGRDVTLRGFALNRWMSFGEEQPAQAKALAQLDAWLASGAVVPAVARTARLEDAREAVAAALAPGGSGKVLLDG